ncbi:MAG TPA: translation initiation factor IF-2 [Candidatus Absconditabacterales bacterium]|nr:translation initiation factor IF-2 [Candidatus Absconditabacterales bacterium]HOQ78920.1 translation initiation factor IF-2 [Candidatus Absconditabacterales bacterium]HPK28048.1 translation initiation factor IF-2 [Candidatus Absconditabacterales bacterium]
MPRIEDVIKDLGVAKGTFSRYYEKVTGKEITAKTVIVSDANLLKIKKLLEKNGKLGAKVVKKEETKPTALKSDELLGGGGFLAGLGFTRQEETPVYEDDDEDEIIEDLTEEEEAEIQKVIQDEFASKPSKQDLVKKEKKSSVSVTVEDIISHSGRPAPKTITYEKPRYDKKSGGDYPRGQKVKGVITTSKGKYKETENTQIEEQKVVKKPKIATTSANLVKKEEIVIDGNISVKEFSEKMGVPLNELMRVLMQNQLMLGITANLDFDTASLIAEEFGVTVKKEENTQMDLESFITGDLQSLLDMDKEASHLEERAPIVTIMGHVDHGKTTLLDYLRKTAFASKEAGGITQSIGASIAECNGKKITFIDTPGHELFTDLRARGAKLTNVAVIVVAADDSVMPQTIESINHAKSAGVPIIIAITKIDKEGKKNIEQIKTDLSANGITPEDWGGETPIIPVSGKTGAGIPELLEAILLQAEMLELKYNPDRSAIGVVLDAHKDPKQGVVTSMIVMTGTLKVGDVIVAYNTYGKVRRMQDWTGKIIRVARGGEPIQILGITDLPEAGRMVEVVKNEKEASTKITLIQEQEIKQGSKSAVQDFLSKLGAGDSDEKTELRLILKSDGSSSLSALEQAVLGVSTPDNVIIKIVHQDVGHFNDSDLSLAQASGALLLGFNISINSVLKKKAEQMKVEMKAYDVIYELTTYLEDLTMGMIKYEEIEVVTGKLEILGIFYTKGKEMVVGGKVIEGIAQNKSKFRVIRGEDIIAGGEIISLHKNKDEIKKANEGEECGMKVKVSKKIEEGDIIEFWEMQEVK